MYLEQSFLTILAKIGTRKKTGGGATSPFCSSRYLIVKACSKRALKTYQSRAIVKVKFGVVKIQWCMFRLSLDVKPPFPRFLTMKLSKSQAQSLRQGQCTSYLSTVSLISL